MVRAGLACDVHRHSRQRRVQALPGADVGQPDAACGPRRRFPGPRIGSLAAAVVRAHRLPDLRRLPESGLDLGSRTERRPRRQQQDALQRRRTHVDQQELELSVQVVDDAHPVAEELL